MGLGWSGVVQGQALVPVCQSPGVQAAVSASSGGLGLLCVDFLMCGGREGWVGGQGTKSAERNCSFHHIKLFLQSSCASSLLLEIINMFFQ